MKFYIAGKFAVIDDEDFSLIDGKQLSVIGSKSDCRYVVVGRPAIPLHRLVLQANEGEVVHHRDGNGLNNSRSNLIKVSACENSKGKTGHRRRHKLAYKGYGLKCTSYGNTYRAEIGVDYQHVYLGTYENEVDAAIAYDLAALKYFGVNLAILNFPIEKYKCMTLEKWREERAIKKKRGGRWSMSLRKFDERMKELYNHPVEKEYISTTEMADLLGMSRGHFHQLVKEEIFPKPDSQYKKRMFYSKSLQENCLSVMRTRVGYNGTPYVPYNKGN